VTRADRGRSGWCWLLVLLLVICQQLTACNRAGEPAPGIMDVSLLLYDEQEPGTDVYPVRILASDEYLRLDDNYDDSDFVLLERHSGTIFSVSHEEKSILVIDNYPTDQQMPSTIVLTEVSEEDSGAPLIAGRHPIHVLYKANEAVCYEAMVVPDLMGQVTGAMIEYVEILGRRQLNSLRTVPGAMQTPCFLSRYGYAPARHLVDGLPVQEWDATGYRRTLTNFKDQESVSTGLFELPDGYERYRIDNPAAD
jgi:hypothetical protein